MTHRERGIENRDRVGGPERKRRREREKDEAKFHGGLIQPHPASVRKPESSAKRPLVPYRHGDPLKPDKVLSDKDGIIFWLNPR